MKKHVLTLYKPFFLIIFSISELTCGSNSHLCRFREIKTINYNGTPDSTYGTLYFHSVLLTDFSRECMDSATIVKIALHYIDTVGAGKPVNIIAIFNSTKDFIPNQFSQIGQEVNKSCLVTMGINPKTKLPDEFQFYNDKGDLIYWGKKWIPFPKGKDVFR
jgi:hypothetical protein